MAEPWEYCAKWNNSVTERQIVHDSIYRVIKLIEVQSRMAVGEGIRNYYLMVTEFQFYKIKRVMEIEGWNWMDA